MTVSINSNSASYSLPSHSAIHGGSAPSEEATLQTVAAPNWLGKVTQGLVKLCWVNQEIKIWSQRDRSGNVWWSAYNPMTDELLHQVSEDDLRRWIESRGSLRP